MLVYVVFLICWLIVSNQEFYCFLFRFSRASVQTVLPPNRKSRAPRLCSSFDEQIKKNERGVEMGKEKVGGSRKRKRDALEQLRIVDDSILSVKVRFTLNFWYRYMRMPNINLGLNLIKLTWLWKRTSRLTCIFPHFWLMVDIKNALDLYWLHDSQSIFSIN